MSRGSDQTPEVPPDPSHPVSDSHLENIGTRRKYNQVVRTQAIPEQCSERKASSPSNTPFRSFTPCPSRGLPEPAPLQVPQFQHRTQAGTGKRCGSNHMDTSRNQSSGIPRVYWVQVCCPAAAPEPSETRLCVCEQRSAPAATEQPRQLICKLHLRTLKYFSI